jgi:hypothetical protein
MFLFNQDGKSSELFVAKTDLQAFIEKAVNNG